MVYSQFDLSNFGFFTRGTVKEFLSFASREIVARTTPGGKQSVKHHMNTDVVAATDFMCHCSISFKKLGCCIITDNEYPMRVGYEFIHKATDEIIAAYSDKIYSITVDTSLKMANIEQLFVKYQQPKEVDSIMKLQQNIDETKGILLQTLDSLLIRGEKLEDLVAKSQDLSFHSKAFMKSSKDLNKCCTII